MLKFLTLKPEAFGLDISDLSLKVIQLERKREGFDLASFGGSEVSTSTGRNHQMGRIFSAGKNT